MNTKHTPGPWTQDGNTVAYRTNDGLSSHVAHLDPMWLCEEHGGTVDANARLIAAAPELLEALRAMLDSAPIQVMRADHPFAVALNKAEVAIHNATKGA